jgi:spore germination cell wall hydrolase CwlJ-like protein
MLMKTFAPETHDTQMLAKTAIGEARGEGDEGMRAVMHTVMNRLSGLPHGSSISDVVLAPKQFSAWNAGNPNREFMENVNLDENESLIDMAEKVISKRDLDPTGGATHYFAPGEIEAPGWAGKMEKTATVGGHEFFKGKRGRP